MSTLNGFGALYYGWRHASDGTATATKWLAASWLPIVPLQRQHLRVLTDFDNPQRLKAELGGLVVSQTDHYQVIANTPLSTGEIALTLAKTYLGLPALLFAPMCIVVLLMKLLQHMGVDVRPGTTAFNIFIGASFATLLNFLYQAVRAIRKARGWQPKIKGEPQANPNG